MAGLVWIVVVRHGLRTRGVLFEGGLRVRGAAHRGLKVAHGVRVNAAAGRSFCLTPRVGFHGGPLEHRRPQHRTLIRGTFVLRTLEGWALELRALEGWAREGWHHSDRVMIHRLHAAVAGEAWTAAPLQLRHRLMGHFEDGLVHQTIPDRVKCHK